MEQLLAYFNSLRSLSEGLTEQLHKSWKPRQIKKGAFLVKAGKINNHAFFIKKGLVRSYSLKKGKQITRWLLRENDFIASIESYMTQKPGRENMQALEDCDLLAIDFTELERIYSLFPEFERHGRIVTQRYSSLWYTMLDGIKMQTARERYEFLLARFPDLVQRVPGKYLASYLDMNEYTLSKIRRKR